MAKRRLNKAQRLAVLKRLGDEYALRENETEEGVTRCEGCGAIFRADIAGTMGAMRHLIELYVKGPNAPRTPLLCVRCKAFELSKKAVEKRDGE